MELEEGKRIRTTLAANTIYTIDQSGQGAAGLIFISYDTHSKSQRHYWGLSGDIYMGYIVVLHLAFLRPGCSSKRLLGCCLVKDMYLDLYIRSV